jgi:hypothetical protein
VAGVTLKYSPYAKIICTIAIYKERNNIMNIQTFSKYYQYSLKDKVLPIRCGVDEEHPILVPNLELDDEYNEKIYLYCLDCNFKIYPGLELYNNIEFVLEELEIDEED